MAATKAWSVVRAITCATLRVSEHTSRPQVSVGSQSAREYNSFKQKFAEFQLCHRSGHGFIRAVRDPIIGGACPTRSQAGQLAGTTW